MPNSYTTELQMKIARADALTGPLLDLGRRDGADQGDPRVSGIDIYATPEIRCGVWESTPGGWNIVDRQGTESMSILFGRVRITELGANPVELGPGDVFVLPPGWTGRWETLETVRKVFTHYLGPEV